MSDATDVIIGTTVVLVGTTILRKSLDKGNPQARGSQGKTGDIIGKPVVFGFLLVMALLVISMVAPNVAKGLAYLALVGAFVVNGPSLFVAVGRIGQ